MTQSELAHLELLAEVDALMARLERWIAETPPWQPAETCRALVRRLAERTESLRVRLDSPLVVATLGGTGTGKSSLVNALVGDEVVHAGRQRPTTRRPTLVCRPDLAPEMLGIAPECVEVVQRDLPSLAHLVIVDCPDPDTTEDADAAGTNLAALRQVLPHCDVLLVTATQQKYRSARVNDELRSAALGARLIFVQTHADADDDIRADWADVLREQYATGHLFLIDSLGALAAQRAGHPPTGEFGRLVDLLTRQLVGSAGNRIRRANFLDLVADTLALCRERLEAGEPAVRHVRAAIEQQRLRLAGRLASQMHDDLLASRRSWETRLLGKVASRWGVSPFALVLRAFHGTGGALTRAFWLRVRTPAQIALWGALEGARSLQRMRQDREAGQAVADAAARCWDEADLRQAALVVGGYVADAELERRVAGLETVLGESRSAGAGFVDDVSGQLEELIGRMAERHTGWLTRGCYEALLVAVVGAILYRLGKNFFWDSWLASNPTGLYGFEYYGIAVFWLLLWCGVLLWAFTRRLRRGLRREIDALAQRWGGAAPARAIFGRLETICDEVDRFRQDLQSHAQSVAALRQRLALPDAEMGARR